MPAPTIRIGIIGVGQIGKHHLETYTALAAAGVNVQLVAAADVNATELANVAAKYKIGATHANFRDLLKRDDIDAVDVCLHNNFHAPMTIAALEAGKHVYCEKPMAGTYIDAKAMYDTARRVGKKLSIQLSTVFSKETKVARKLIEAGKLGKLYHARSTGFRRRGRPFVDGYGTDSFVKKSTAAGGALYDMGVYHISQVLFLLNTPTIERITGMTYQETEMDERRRKSSGFDVEELGVGFVRCAGGLTIDVIESWAIHLDGFEGSSIVGSAGGVRLNPFGYFANMTDVPINATFDLGGADWRWHQLNETEDAYDSPQAHWVAALQGRVPLLPTDQVALNTMLISEGIFLSTRLGREVTTAEVESMSKSTAIKV